MRVKKGPFIGLFFLYCLDINIDYDSDKYE